MTASRKGIGGRPRNQKRDGYVQAYSLTRRQSDNRLTPESMAQLDACKDDMARRLLLGCTEQFAPGEAPELPRLRERFKGGRPKMPALPPRRPVERVSEPEAREWVRCGDWSEEYGPAVTRMVRLAGIAI